MLWMIWKTAVTTRSEITDNLLTHTEQSTYWRHPWFESRCNYLLSIETEICHDFASVSHKKCQTTALEYTTYSLNIWGSYKSAYEGYCLLGYDAVESGRVLPLFWRNLLPPSSEVKIAAPGSSEVLIIIYHITWHHIAEGHELNWGLISFHVIYSF
jgi:hypothetical protein